MPKKESKHLTFKCYIVVGSAFQAAKLLYRFETGFFLVASFEAIFAVLQQQTCVMCFGFRLFVPLFLFFVAKCFCVTLQRLRTILLQIHTKPTHINKLNTHS